MPHFRTPKIEFPTLSTTQIILRIASIVIVWEFVIMLVLGSEPLQLNTYTIALLDTLLLTSCTTPFIYFWVIRPFTLARDNALNELDVLAHTDPLTQLTNRRGLFRSFETWLEQKGKQKQNGAVFIIDLDGFKVINDIQGHDAGDAVLVEVANRLNLLLKKEDMAGRLGGDEFMVVLTNLKADNAVAQAEALETARHLCQQLQQAIRFQNHTLHVGASIGVRLISPEDLHSDDIIKDADSAMYRAKQAGKSCAVLYSENTPQQL